MVSTDRVRRTRRGLQSRVLGRGGHLVAVVGQDVAEARPALLWHCDGGAEVALHLQANDQTW